MDINPTGEVTLVDRVKAILLRPRDEWPVIAREPATSGEVFTRYVMPLAAIGPVCAFLGGQLFGYGGFWFRWRPSLLASLSSAIGSYIAALIAVLAVAVIANQLSPRFGGETNQRNAFKLVAYSMTAGWVAAAFQIIPALAWLGIAGLYSLYLFYVGAAPLLRIPQDRAMPFTAVTVAISIVLALVVGAIMSAIFGMLGGAMSLFGGHPAISTRGGDVTLTAPGGVTIDTRKMEEAANNLQAAITTGNGKAIAPAALQALLPGSIGAYKRTAVESGRAGPAGSRTEGTYEAGDKRFRLSVADMSAIGAIAGIGAAMGVEQNREDADGYERTTTRDGVLVSEKWNKSGNGSFGTMVGKRFFVEAEGDANSIDELKGAVASIDPGRLAALAGS